MRCSRRAPLKRGEGLLYVTRERGNIDMPKFYYKREKEHERERAPQAGRQQAGRQAGRQESTHHFDVRVIILS